ncbi:uncharacterized protein LOC113457152 isoform X2 [Microtus ochrogaster]|uniref:Uncharacterized protein LOC113457152 isoform X2 n=1 Tax=Microtus ochrogaster TaxID=79684 RepID=A0ABM1UBW3_MICOH|nr:uncharacterized protein LOC113457152 isoform X2 [Microtus ochrogaster]
MTHAHLHQRKTPPSKGGSRKKPKEDKVLVVSLLHSTLGRLANTISFCQFLGQDASGEASKPEAAKVYLPRRQPTEESMAANLSLLASSALLKEHLLPKDSKILSPVLLNSSVSMESQSTMSASQPAEILTSGSCHSLPWASSLASHSADPAAFSSMTDCSTAATRCDWKALETSQRTPLPGFPSPILTIPGLDYSKTPTSTTSGLVYSRETTTTTPGLDPS